MSTLIVRNLKDLDTGDSASVAAIINGSLNVTSRNIFYNTDHVRAPINTTGFDGNWNLLAVDDYGYDGWLKYSTTHKAQVIEDGDFIPSTIYTISYDGVEQGQITSPATGNWLVAVPFAVDMIDLKLGSAPTPWHPENNVDKLHKCQRYFYRRNATSGSNFSAIGPAVAFGVDVFICVVDLPVMMRTSPTLLISDSADFRIVDRNTAVVDTVSQYTQSAPEVISFNITTTNAPAGDLTVMFTFNGSAGWFAGDARFLVADAGANIEVVG